MCWGSRCRRRCWRCGLGWVSRCSSRGGRVEDYGDRKWEGKKRSGLVRGELNIKRRRTSNDLAMVEIRAGSGSQDYAHGSVRRRRPIYITCLTRLEAKAGPRDCEGVLVLVKVVSLGEGDGS